MAYDLLIKNGRVVDGSGGPSFQADVAVHQGKIVGIGKLSAAATRTINAEGRVVAPGFIDHHTHYDPQALWDPLCSYSVQNGNTTVIVGMCGQVLAPARPGDHDWYLNFFAEAETIPLSAIQKGVQFTWESIAEYLEALSQRRGINETISSLLLFYIALSLFLYLVEGPLRDPASLNKPSTRPLQDAHMLPLIPGTEVHYGIVFGVLACLAAYVLMDHSRFGFGARVVGGNLRTAKLMGLPVSRLFVITCVALGYLGSQPPEGWYLVFGRIFTLYYFAFFLLVMPVVGLIERPRRLPGSITESVLGPEEAKAHPAHHAPRRAPAEVA